MPETFLGGRVAVYHGDSLDVLRSFDPNSVDAVVCDPPYGLGVPPDPVEMLRAWIDTGHLDVSGRGFMGHEWDAFVPQPALWREVFRVLKPGGHVLAFFGTRTYDLGSLAIRLAGFEIRDLVAWIYGSGFPKSMDMAKAIDKALGERGTFGDPKSPAHAGWIDRGRMRGDSGAEGWQRPWMENSEAVENAARKYIPATETARDWEGWGTALKPALEPVCFARKPFRGTVAANVLAHGTGAINVDGCRIESEGGSAARGSEPSAASRYADRGSTNFAATPGPRGGSDKGRWPANIVHDGSAEVVGAFPISDGQQGDIKGTEPSAPLSGDVYGRGLGRVPVASRNDSGSAARFFYSAKAGSADRIYRNDPDDRGHPTVKPVALMQWLCRLVTPPGGIVLDPFAGTGTTGEAAWREGFRSILIERDKVSVEDIRRRLRLAERPSERKAFAKSKGKVESVEALPLFGGIE